MVFSLLSYPVSCLKRKAPHMYLTNYYKNSLERREPELIMQLDRSLS